MREGQDHYRIGGLGSSLQIVLKYETRGHRIGQKWSKSRCVALSLFVLMGDIAKAGVSDILGTPRVAYERLRGRADPASPVSNAPWITRG